MWFAGRMPTLEEQVGNLARCGVQLRTNLGVPMLLRAYERDQYESAPYELLLRVMGANLSTDVWLLDTECVDGPGAYTTVARRMETLAKGEFSLQRVADQFLPEGEVWLTFECAGKAYRWPAQLDDDWLDGRILSGFEKLLESTGSKRRFTYSNMGGQECLIGCATAEQLAALNALGGPRFVWLT